MTEEIRNNGDDLTTDAIPSPPRDNKQRTENAETRNSSTNSSKKKKKTTAFANVINISNANGIHIGSNYNVYMNNKSDKEEPKNKDFVVTPKINALFSSKEQVTKHHIRYISQHINEKWSDTARFLHYSSGQISQFHDRYKDSGLKEVIYKFLLDWIENETDAATVGKLSDALWQTSQEECVQRWVENFT